MEPLQATSQEVYEGVMGFKSGLAQPLWSEGGAPKRGWSDVIGAEALGALTRFVNPGDRHTACLQRQSTSMEPTS